MYISKPDGLDVAALLAAEQIAGAANLEVEGRHPESAAKIAEFANGGEPLLRDRRQRRFRRNQQIRIRRTIRTADAAAQLIQLRQAVAIGAIDEDGVDVRDIEAVLDDRRRQQHVVLLADEVEHRPLELVFSHLAVRHDHAGFRDEALDEVADRENRLDPVVNEVHLPAALELVPDGVGDDVRVELDDVGLNREPILRRGLDDRHVADAHERHVQRSRNRCRAQRQHVDLPAHLLDALLVRDAEALLFVDHQQPEVLELNVPRQQAMRADDDVDLARAEVLDDLILFGLAAEPADHVDRHRKSGEPLGQRLLMLKRQHGRRREERHLLSVHHRLERGAHRHFGLAVADVAAEQAIHRRRRFHVALDVVDGVLPDRRSGPIRTRHRTRAANANRG